MAKLRRKRLKRVQHSLKTLMIRFWPAWAMKTFVDLNSAKRFKCEYIDLSVKTFLLIFSLYWYRCINLSGYSAWECLSSTPKKVEKRLRATNIQLDLDNKDPNYLLALVYILLGETLCTNLVYHRSFWKKTTLLFWYTVYPCVFIVL